MATTDKRVDAYIAKSAPFAQPILRELRARVHAACPNAEETIKWGFPNFVYEGALLCNMASFKAHCAFGFWKGKLLREAGLEVSDEAMGQMGRIASVKDLPGKSEFRRLVKAAMKLNEAPTRVARPVTKPGTRKPIPVPADFTAALAKNARARKAFEAFAPSHRREYLEWITEAKRVETREKRIAQAVEWIAEGKQRNWKYQDC